MLITKLYDGGTPLDLKVLLDPDMDKTAIVLYAFLFEHCRHYNDIAIETTLGIHKKDLRKYRKLLEKKGLLLFEDNKVYLGSYDTSAIEVKEEFEAFKKHLEEFEWASN